MHTYMSHTKLSHATQNNHNVAVAQLTVENDPIIHHIIHTLDKSVCQMYSTNKQKKHVI